MLFCGLNQFAKENNCVSFLNLFIIATILGIDLITSYFLIKKRKNIISKKEKNILILLSCFSSMLALMSFPILNNAHTYLAIYVAIIQLLFIINLIRVKCNININRLNKCATIVLIGMILINLTINIDRLFKWYNLGIKNQELEYSYPFFGAIIQDDTKKEIKEITEFIVEMDKKGINTIIFSPRAALYQVPLKKSNSFYDLPFNGNWGNLKEEEIINDLKNRKNTIILIEKEEKNRRKWQENEEIIKRIENEFNYLDDINNFKIFTSYNLQPNSL